MRFMDLSGLTVAQHEAIADIIDEFDFEAVREYMKDKNWGWKTEDDDGNEFYEIPNTSKLISGLRRLLVNAFNNLNECIKTDPNYNGCCYSSSGGFTVYCWYDNRCQAYFSISEWWHDSEY